MERGIETFILVGKQSLRRSDGAVVVLTRHGGLFVLQRRVVSCSMLLALVDEDPAEAAPVLPLVDEVMERELMGREEALAPVALEVPAPGKPSSDGRRHRGLTYIPYQAWCNDCVRARAREEPGMNHDHKSSHAHQAHQSFNATTVSGKLRKMRP